MIITFFSSVLNHHQISLSDYLAKTKGVTFNFVQMIPLSKERTQQGFSYYQRSYLVKIDEEPEKAERLCFESDVVIAGVTPQDWINKRVSNGKLTFAYKERFCKSFLAIFSPMFWLTGFRNYFIYRNKELYLLCASSYTSHDTALIFPRRSKKFKWGYFPATSTCKDLSQLFAEKKPNSLLWVGRFIKWKHPELALYLAKMLKSDGYKFSLKMIGIGEMREELQKIVMKENLEDCVKILEARPNEEVRLCMRKSDIFLFTSDRKEGWGAVLNEAMSEGCACIASKQAGSVDYLIKNGINGFSLNYYEIKAWYKCLKHILDDRKVIRKIQQNAFLTIEKEWNAKVAADRLVDFCYHQINDNNSIVFQSGPMSKAH